MTTKPSPQTVYAHAAAIAAQAVGYVVAFVPSLRPIESGAIAVGGIVLSGVILVANAIKAKPASETDAQAAEAAVAGALSHVDFTAIVRGELARLVGAANTSTGSSPAVSAPPAPPTGPRPVIP